MINTEAIFNIKTEQEFSSLALDIFKLQFENNKVYRSFCDLLYKHPSEVKTIKEIPVSVGGEPETGLDSSCAGSHVEKGPDLGLHRLFSVIFQSGRRFLDPSSRVHQSRWLQPFLRIGRERHCFHRLTSCLCPGRGSRGQREGHRFRLEIHRDSSYCVDFNGRNQSHHPAVAPARGSYLWVLEGRKFLQFRARRRSLVAGRPGRA